MIKLRLGIEHNVWVDPEIMILLAISHCKVDSNVVCSFDILDKNHCQVYKVLTGQIIPLSLLCADIVMVE